MNKFDKKALKHEYREVVQLVEQALNDWDPYCLIEGGAPEDEFAEEATRIAASLDKIKTPAELAQVISDIFSKNFENDLFSFEACLPVASRLFTSLSERGFLK